MSGRKVWIVLYHEYGTGSDVVGVFDEPEKADAWICEQEKRIPGYRLATSTHECEVD